MNGLITAIRTLTILRIPGRDADDLSKALPWFPVVGTFIGAAVAAVAYTFCEWLLWPAGAAVLCVTLSTLVTGGLHIDGLADAFDSFGGHTRERKLEIMKDPRIGSFGVMAIVMCLLMKTVAIARLCGPHICWQLVIPFVLSRTTQALPIVFLPYARAEGGTGRRFVENAKPAHFVVSLLIGTAVSIGISPFAGLVSSALALCTAALLASWMRRTFGGVTGDLLGMTSEIVETILLMLLACGQGL